jgi:hypothetical protein
VLREQGPEPEEAEAVAAAAAAAPKLRGLAAEEGAGARRRW